MSGVAAGIGGIKNSDERQSMLDRGTEKCFPGLVCYEVMLNVSPRKLGTENPTAGQEQRVVEGSTTEAKCISSPKGKGSNNIL